MQKTRIAACKKYEKCKNNKTKLNLDTIDGR